MPYCSGEGRRAAVRRTTRVESTAKLSRVPRPPLRRGSPASVRQGGSGPSKNVSRGEERVAGGPADDETAVRRLSRALRSDVPPSLIARLLVLPISLAALGLVALIVYTPLIPLPSGELPGEAVMTRGAFVITLLPFGLAAAGVSFWVAEYWERRVRRVRCPALGSAALSSVSRHPFSLCFNR